MEKTKNILMFTGEVEGSKEKKRGGGGGRVEQIFLFFSLYFFFGKHSLGIAWGFNFKLPKFCCVKQHRFNALM